MAFSGEHDTDSSEGLRSSIDDTLYFKVDLNKSQIANVYVRESQYSHFEDAWHSEPTIDYFHRVEKIDQWEENQKMIEEVFDEETNSTVKTINSSNYLLRMYIRLGENMEMFEVSGYSLATMLSEVGGLFSLVFTGSQVLVIFLAKDRFYGNLT